MAESDDDLLAMADAPSPSGGDDPELAFLNPGFKRSKPAPDRIGQANQSFQENTAALRSGQPASQQTTDDSDDALLSRADSAQQQQADSSFGSMFMRAGKAVAQPFIDLGKGIKSANDFAAQAMAHPIDTFSNPATQRELLRGINSNIPFANKAVEAIGGIPAESAEDAAAATPGASSFGGVAGMPLGSMVGGIAAKGVEAVAPAASHFIQKFGEAAKERQAARAMESLEEKTYKRTRAGIRHGVVEDVVRDNPELLKAAAAGKDGLVAKATETMRKQASEELASIYKSAKPAVEDVTAPISNMDRRIAELAKGTSEDREVAKQLKAIRDELNNSLGTDEALDPMKLRREQSAYQKKGYGKAMPGDDAATARIAANREASKAVGDAVVHHVTGMNYAEAKAFAEANPDSVAARLFKANDQINAANKIEAGIVDRAGRVKPDHGIKAIAKRVAHHAVAPALMGATHGPSAGILTALGQEALHMAPDAIRTGARLADSAIAGTAPALARGAQALPDAVLARAILGLMRRGIPQETAIQMARSGTLPPPQMQAPQPAFADNGDIQL